MSSFLKQVEVEFDKEAPGFEDNLVISKMVDNYTPPMTQFERDGNSIWRPIPYILPSFTGTDQTANFMDVSELAVPITVDQSVSVPIKFQPTDMNDPSQINKIMKAALQRLASQVNIAVNGVLAMNSTMTVPVSGPMTGFQDIAAIDSLMNSRGIPAMDRFVALSSPDYNSGAANLAARQTLQGKALTAYERAYIGEVSGFETYKLDYAPTLAAATAVGVTVNGTQRYVPVAVQTQTTGFTTKSTPVDNRYMNLSVTVTSGTIKVGDRFGIVGSNSVHLESKQDSGQLLGHTVVGIVSGAGGTGVITISPPIISADSSPTTAEKQYQNATAPAISGNALTFYNTVAAKANPFWFKDTVLLVNGQYNLQSGDGWSVRQYDTENGLTVYMTDRGDINDLTQRYRFDIRFGVNLLVPDMAGVILFNQT